MEFLSTQSSEHKDSNMSHEDLSIKTSKMESPHGASIKWPISPMETPNGVFPMVNVDPQWPLQCIKQELKFHISFL